MLAFLVPLALVAILALTPTGATGATRRHVVLPTPKQSKISFAVLRFDLKPGSKRPNLRLAKPYKPPPTAALVAGVARVRGKPNRYLAIVAVVNFRARRTTSAAAAAGNDPSAFVVASNGFTLYPAFGVGPRRVGLDVNVTSYADLRPWESAWKSQSGTNWKVSSDVIIDVLFKSGSAVPSLFRSGTLLLRNLVGPPSPAFLNAVKGVSGSPPPPPPPPQLACTVVLSQFDASEFTGTEQCNRATGGFDYTVPGGRVITNYLGQGCTPSGSTFRCRGSFPANTPFNFNLRTSPPWSPGMGGAVTVVDPSGQAAGTFSASGP